MLVKPDTVQNNPITVNIYRGHNILFNIKSHFDNILYTYTEPNYVRTVTLIMGLIQPHIK